MIFKRNPYDKYEGLSPIYRGWYTNHVPMLYTLLESCQVSDDIIEGVLDFYKEDKDLYELTDITYPTSQLELDYVAKTNYHLSAINQYGLDIAIGNYLAVQTSSIPSALYHGWIRLAYGVRSRYDLLVAQGMAYFDVVRQPYLLLGKPMKVDQFSTANETLKRQFQECNITFESNVTMEKFDQLSEERSLQTLLFVDPNIANQPEHWLKFILQEYMKTSGFFTLHTITAFHAYLMMEEFVTDAQAVLSSWMTSSQLMMLLDTETTPLHVTTVVEWETIMANIHLLGDAHRMKLIFALYEIQQRYDIEECHLIASALYI